MMVHRSPFFRTAKKLAALLIFLLIYDIAYAGIPRLINYQGVLTDAYGKPVVDGSYVITFSLYEEPFGGTSFWTEVLPIVTISGYFNVMLGAQTKFKTFPEGGSWLGIKVGNDEEMALRTNLASVPYAFQVSDSSIGTDQLKDNSVTLEKILPPIISSINGIPAVNGNIEFLADGGISIIADSVEMTLTISSSVEGGGSGGSVNGSASMDSIEILNKASSRIIFFDANEDDAGSAEFLSSAGQTTFFITTEATSPSSGAIGIFDDNNFAAGIFGQDGGGGLIQIVNSSGALTVNLDGNDLGGGSVALTNGLGATTIFLDGVFGDISATGLKLFRVPHPTDQSKEINYVAIEGPEAGMYVRGSAHLESGIAIIALPDHFRLLASEGSVTVTLTPLSASSLGLAVVEKSIGGFRVRELSDGTGSYEFDWLVQAVRKGYEDFEVVRSKRSEKTLKKLKFK